MSSRILLITGATGTQGGAVVRSLLERGDGSWTLRALVRDPSSEKAKAQQARGVLLVKGDLNDTVSVAAAVKGAYGVYSVQTFQGKGQDVEVEERQGKLLASVAAEAGVEHFVYSSVAGAETNSGVPHFESKWKIEQHIRELKLPATMVRPTMFMENLQSPVFRAVVMSLWKTFVPEDRSLQLIAGDDIGNFVRLAFSDPQSFIGKEIDLAGDTLTRRQAIEVLKRAGRPPLFSVRLPKPMLGRLPKEIPIMFAWMGNVGSSADVPALRRLDPSLKTLEQWASALGK